MLSNKSVQNIAGKKPSILQKNKKFRRLVNTALKTITRYQALEIRQSIYIHSCLLILVIQRKKLVLFLDKFPFSNHPTKNFINSLKDHLLVRLLGRTFDGDTDEAFTPEDRLTVRIKNETIFRVRTARINYTTYDLQRARDTINPRNHPYIQ